MTNIQIKCTNFKTLIYKLLMLILQSTFLYTLYFKGYFSQAPAKLDVGHARACDDIGQVTLIISYQFLKIF